MNRRELLLGVLLAPIIKPLAALLPAPPLPLLDVVNVQDFGAILEEGLSRVFTDPLPTSPMLYNTYMDKWKAQYGTEFAMEKAMAHWELQSSHMGSFWVTKNPYGDEIESS